MIAIHTLSLLGALSAPAQAGPSTAVTHELNAELDMQMMSDDNWDDIAWSDSMRTLGFSGGYGLTRNLTLMVGIHHRKYVNQTDAYYWDYSEEYEYGNTELETSLSATQLSVGPKVSVELKPWLRPYATAQAVAWIGVLGADDDIDKEDNLNQLQWRAMSPGIEAAAGFDIVPIRKDRVHFATHIDFGYAAAMSLKFTDSNGSIGSDGAEAPVGTLAMHGFHVNWGVGVHF